MTYVADSYLRASAALNEIQSQVTQEINRRERFVAGLTEVADRLGDLAQPAPTGWLDTVQYIDAQATANPTDQTWQRLKAEKDKIVADFNAEQTKTQAINTAIAGI